MRGVGRALGCAVAVAGVLVGTAAPADAHVINAGDAKHYRSSIDSITPAGAPFTVHVEPHGAWIEVSTNGPQLVVLGYFGEPYLRVTPAQVEVNALAPTAELNGGLVGALGPADVDNVHRDPQWRAQSAGPTVRWHDLRTHWVDASRPADVAADPRHGHVIDNWQVVITAAGTAYTVAGTLRWTPVKPTIPPALLAFFAVDTVVLVAVGALVWRGRRSRRLRAAGVAIITPVS
jgi:hypothetical protein